MNKKREIKKVITDMKIERHGDTSPKLGHRTHSPEKVGHRGQQMI